MWIAALDGATELIELFVVDVGEYRNTAQHGSFIGRTRLGRRR